jgi:hypothetical protein
MKKITTGKLDKHNPTSRRPQLTLVQGAHDRRSETKTAATREDSAVADASEPAMPYAHVGALARAMKANPGLTYEEALEMARDLGF